MTRTCSVSGCRMRLRGDSPYTECCRHRPKHPGGHSRTKDAQARAQKRHQERVSGAGIPTAWEGAT